MKLNALSWTGAGGVNAEWKQVCGRRTAESLTRLKIAAEGFKNKSPSGVGAGFSKGMRYFLKKRGPQRDRLARHPALDYWLFLWDRHFGMPLAPSDWNLHGGLFSGLAAWLALESGDRLALDSVLDPNAELHFYGSSFHLRCPPSFAGAPVALSIGAAQAEITVAGLPRFKFSHGGLARAGSASSAQAVALRSSRVIAPGLCVEDRSWLITHGVSMHGLTRLNPEAQERFALVISSALKELSELEPGIHEEFTDLVSLLIPLVNPLKFGSVSSSYANMRGAVCLSHSEDVLLQAETLIHEFCHQKINQLLCVDPLLAPGQSGQVYYSPWRKDARRLRGLLLGAHAFLNVARFHSKSLARKGYRDKDSIDLMHNIALRLFQISEALRSLALYAALTPFGREFVAEMWRELGVLLHGVQWFPTRLLRAARQRCADHRRRHALFETGFHKSADFADRLERAPYLGPGGAEAAVRAPRARAEAAA